MYEISVHSSIIKLFRNIQVDSKVSINKHDFIFLLQIRTLKAMHIWHEDVSQ